jgi:HsdM N-terminal domain
MAQLQLRIDTNNNTYTNTTRSMFAQAFKNIDEILRKEAGCTAELDYIEHTSWLLFLKYLDGLEEDRATEATLDGKRYTYILLANHPFGGHERREVQQNFPIRTSETAFLFLQHFIRMLRVGGHGGVVIKNPCPRIIALAFNGLMLSCR